MKTLQSNHVPPRTNNLVWLRGNAASSHPCKSLGSSYEGFPIPDGLVRSSRPTGLDAKYEHFSLAACLIKLTLALASPWPALPYGRNRQSYHNT